MKMGCCLSRDNRKERVASSITKIAENTSQLVIVHRQLTSATSDLRRTYSDGIGATRELNSSQENCLRSLRTELAKIKAELREINNTCRIKAGGLPTVQWQRGDCETSDCDSINSGHSSVSVKSISKRSSRAFPVAHHQATPMRAVYENDGTLTRSFPGLDADCDGYVLPTSLSH